jgi:zinc transporter ZupT
VEEESLCWELVHLASSLSTVETASVANSYNPARTMASHSDVEDILFSILMINLKVQPLTEACFQNFCGGLILAAVSLELLPLMSPSETTTPFHSFVGTTLGFILGVIMINGVSKLIDSFENDAHLHGPLLTASAKCDVSLKDFYQKDQDGNTKQNFQPLWALSPNGGKKPLPWMSTNTNSQERSIQMKELLEENETTKILTGSTKQTYGQQVPYTIDTAIQNTVSLENFDLDRAGCAEDGYDHEAILYAAMAIATPSHRAHIKEHLTEIMSAICILEGNTVSLMRGNSPAELGQTEKLAEEVDEEIHMLQYRLDHTRR